jgi:hypothetical protein
MDEPAPDEMGAVDAMVIEELPYPLVQFHSAIPPVRSPANARPQLRRLFEKSRKMLI